MSSAENATPDISPKPPAPLYPDVPWWAVLITAFVFAFLGIIVGAYFGVGGLTSTAGKLTAAGLAIDTISYIPHIILLFGVLADMFTLQGVWSIPSLVGLLSIFANAVFEYFWKGLDELFGAAQNVFKKGTASGSSAPVIPGATKQGGKRQAGGELFDKYTGCEVQGFGSFNSPYAPQTLVVTATVFSYYCFDLIRNRGWINSIAAILSFLSLFIAEVVVIDMNKPTGATAACTVEGSGVQMGAFAQGIRAFFEGLLFGGVSYGVVQTYAPSRLPSSTISPFPRKTLEDLSPGPDGKMYDKDGYPYIVLPNGQAVPDVSDASARAAFGALAGTATGQTQTMASNCPGQTASCPKA